MALVLDMIYKQLHYYVVECRDRRIEHYFLMGSPFKILSIIGLYLYFVHKWGPKFMKNRQPYELKNILIVYNLAQVIVNSVLAVLTTRVLIQKIGQLHCCPVNYNKDAEGMYEVRLAYAYFILKVVDLLDTVFIVLRKRYNQASFLHVYHHTIMAFMTFICVHYIPGGHYGFLGVFNCYVHAIMYFYYFLTSFKPELKTSIWWKKYLTQIQMIQFASIILFYIRPFFYSECKLSKLWLIFAIIQNGFMFAMFADFYYKSYIKKSQKKVK